MKASLYDLLQVSLSDPDSPNILLTVHLSDLHQLVVDTIEATRERLLPIFMEVERQAAHQETGGRTARRVRDHRLEYG